MRPACRRPPRGAAAIARARLTIDLDAIAANWRALDALSDTGVETGAVVKADAYGLGAARVAPALAAAGARSFFVALAEEGAALREVLGPGPAIYVFAGLMPGDAALVRPHALVPVLNSPAQVADFARDLAGLPCAVQLDSGMNRLGLEPAELNDALPALERLQPVLAISHLACADDPGHPMNAAQVAAFQPSPATCPAPALSLAATGGILLGPRYHFDLVRPGIGLYGGRPFADARPVVRLVAPGVQVRDVGAGESVGYGAAWTAAAPPASPPSPPAMPTASRARSAAATSRSSPATPPCPMVGRVSMDLITADVTGLDEVPARLDILTDLQGVDALADAAGTIGYEVLTSLGHRYERDYKGAPARRSPHDPPRLALAFLASIGRSVLGLLAATGRLTIFAGVALSQLVRPPFYPGELGRQLLRIGYFSLPVVGLTALFTGAALALQIRSGGDRFNAGTVVPSIVAIGIVRELGPVLGGLMVAGRVSSSIAAELGTMRVTEQIDALTTLSTDPMKYLVLPRVLAGLIAMPVLVAVANVIGIFGGYLVGTTRLGFNPSAYIKNTLDFLEPADVATSLTKAAVFGFLLALMGCYNGYHSGRGAQGVGEATTNAVVSASILILAANYLLTEAFF